MNVLFLSLADFESFEDRNMYSDIHREFIKNGHRVCWISPVQRRTKQDTHMYRFGENCILKLKVGNIEKVNVIEKGISTLRIKSQIINAIKKYFSDIKFDLIFYETPPVTFARIIKYVKKRDGAKSYLMLKDIFPQNAVDIDMLKKTGVKGLLYKYFRREEKSLYRESDMIGGMSQANCDYLLKHNPEIPPEKVNICPNCLEFIDLRISDAEKMEIRRKYGLPEDKKIFVYGGNLGRPQDVPFIIECFKACTDIKDAFFLVAGTGTDRFYLENFMESEKPDNVKLFGYMPKQEYDRMIVCCDVGLIFLDHRFTIPNFPSRLLSYMQAGLPVYACTDANTDMGEIIKLGGFGWWSKSDDANKFKQTVLEILSNDHKGMSEKSIAFLEENYNSSVAYSAIMEVFK